MAEQKDLVITEGEQGEAIPMIADDRLIAIADQAEKRIEAVRKILRIALSVTNPHDWVDQNGRPYLQASGGEKVARLFGISWRMSEPILENLEGGHFSFTYTGEFSLGGATITAVGTRSSKDGFFKKYEYDEETKKRIGELPPSEIDRGDVKKAAYTNLIGNGVTRLLGIRNLTYDDLKEFAGITKEQITSVPYKKGSKPASQAGKPTITDPDSPATEAQVKAIHAILKDKLGIEDELSKMQKAAKILGLKEVPTSATKLTKGQASIVIAALQKETEGAER